MYRRSYGQGDMLPPNYKGNAFDLRPKETEAPQAEKEEAAKEKDDELFGLASVFTRRDGSSFALDDIILGALIILLLNNHADDELLLILVLLFISGI